MDTTPATTPTTTETSAPDAVVTTITAPAPATPPATPAPITATPPDKQGDKGAVTQEKVNELVGKTRKAGRDGAIADFLKELGYETPDTLKTALQSKKDAAAGEESELQKLTARITALEGERDAAKQAAAAANTARLMSERDGSIREALNKAKCTDAVKVMALVNALTPDLVKATLTDDGAVSAAAVTALVDAAKKDHKEYFVGGGPGSPSVRGGMNPIEPTKKAAGEASFRRARRDI